MGVSMPYLAPGLAFIATFALVYVLRPIAVRVRLTDVPGGRKRHKGEVPLVGGIAMLIGIIAGATTGVESLISIWHLIVPAIMLVIVGTLDDRFGISIYWRFAAQIAAALIMMFGGGLYLTDIGDPFGTGTLGLSFLAMPVSLLITLTVINAWNFIDGIDGLAASMALVVLLGGSLSAGLLAPTSALALIACAAILGFFIFNFPAYRFRHIRAFMGDAGSTLLGFVVVWLTIAVTQGQAREVTPVAALWFALMPLADFFSCFVRRIIKGRSPLSPDREHFHHMLLRAGLTVRQTLLVLVGFASFYALVGVAGTYFEWPDVWLFTPWFLLLCTQYAIIKRLALMLRCRKIRARAQAMAQAETAPIHAGEPRPVYVDPSSRLAAGPGRQSASSTPRYATSGQGSSEQGSRAASR